MKLPEFLDKVQEYAYFGTLGAFAAIVGYLYQVAKKGDVAVSFGMLLVTSLFGFYLGMLFGNLLPADLGNRDALVLIAGASGMKGFDLVLQVSKNLIRTSLGGDRGRSPDTERDVDQG